jgi:hypothetical protein
MRASWCAATVTQGDQAPTKNAETVAGFSGVQFPIIDHEYEFSSPGTHTPSAVSMKMTSRWSNSLGVQSTQKTDLIAEEMQIANILLELSRANT